MELTEACIRQAERVDPALRAFTTLCAEYAMTRARQAEAEVASGNYRGPLHGVPYTLKDVIATSEVRTTWGNPREIDFKPEKSATVHNLLEEAGAVLLGKVYSHIGRGETPVMCYSPWDPSTSPGTTSGGSGRLSLPGWACCPSARIPGLGASPSKQLRRSGVQGNLWPRQPRRGLATSWTTDQAGPLTKTVEDNAIAMEALTGYDANDLVSINLPPGEYLSGLNESIRGLRIGLPADSWVWRDWIGQDEEDAVRRAVAVFEKLGAVVSEVRIPLSYEARNNSLAAEAPVWLRDSFRKTC